MMLESALVAMFFVLVHVFGRRLSFLSRTPRSAWLSAAGGISVAYVFLHLLPQLHEGHHTVQRQAWMSQGRSGVYLVALGGLVLFYGLERLAAGSSAHRPAAGTGAGAFAVHIGSFALYNFVIGYLLLQGERDNMLLYGAAMGLHFLVNDQSLREHYKERYDATGRWVLAAAVVSGWALGLRLEIPATAVQLAVALLAGGVILNVMKEELPEQRASRFGAFLAGAVSYSALLLAAQG